MRPASPQPTTILVIDDDPTVLSVFAQILGLEGYIAHTAMDAEAGLQKADVYRPDAILVDLRMPLANGLEFLQQLRVHEHHRKTPVAIITGDYMVDEEMLAALRAHGATIRFKPLWLEDLVQLTQHLTSAVTR